MNQNSNALRLNHNPNLNLNTKYPSLKFKRRRDLFKRRIESLIEIPNEIKAKYTVSLFNDELAIPLCLQKSGSSKNDFKIL